MSSQIAADVQPATEERAVQLENLIQDCFRVEGRTLEGANSGLIEFRGEFIRKPIECYDEIRRRFEPLGYTPLLRRRRRNAVLVALPEVFADHKPAVLVNLILAMATFFSTLWVGAAGDPTFTGSEIWKGLPFALSIMTILGAHELGHYFAARRHNVPVSLPYFIPMPFSIIGTMGAFIQLKSPVKNKRVLFDVGAAGPIAGMVFAVPILIYGLATSSVGVVPHGEYLQEGNSLLYLALKYLVHGRLLPAGGIDVSLNQYAWAGWVGMLVTGLNLMPLGQLDGGHVAYVLFGHRARLLFWPMIAILLALALVTGSTTWAIWAALLFFLGRRHAMPLDDISELDGRRKRAARLMLVLFILVFVPIPLQTVLAG